MVVVIGEAGKFLENMSMQLAPNDGASIWEDE